MLPPENLLLQNLKESLNNAQKLNLLRALRVEGFATEQAVEHVDWESILRAKGLGSVALALVAELRAQIPPEPVRGLANVICLTVPPGWSLLQLGELPPHVVGADGARWYANLLNKKTLRRVEAKRQTAAAALKAACDMALRVERV